MYFRVFFWFYAFKSLTGGRRGGLKQISAQKFWEWFVKSLWSWLMSRTSRRRLHLTNEAEVVATGRPVPSHCWPRISKLKLRANKLNMWKSQKVLVFHFSENVHAPAAPVKLNDPDETVFLDWLRQTLLPPTKVPNFNTNYINFLPKFDSIPLRDKL